MKISTGIFISYVVLVLSGIILFAQWIIDDVRPGYIRILEENLVESSTILAGMVSGHIENEEALQSSLEQAFTRAYAREFKANIHGKIKKNLDSFVYVTDEKGRVLFHSKDEGQVGEDYSKWNDVFLTLRGEYGVRSTRVNPDDPTTSVYYIAAPIRVDGQIRGVLTVAKPVTWAAVFVEDTQDRIVHAAILVGVCSIVLGLFITLWLTRPITRLTQFSRDVASGKEVALPPLGGVDEIRRMGIAIDQMREALEGKRYIESYVQTLTHELKSPIAAVRGAAELLREADVPDAQRARFLENILSEAERMNRYVERMLVLTTIELQRELKNKSVFSLKELVDQVVSDLKVVIDLKEIDLNNKVGQEILAEGERALLAQAIQNLLQNALEFTPTKGWVSIDASSKNGQIVIQVIDSGSGIPDYAKDKVFDRFYSLPRPDTGKKSSGLGLACVREIVNLHNGSISIENHEAGGCVVTLKLPLENVL